MFVLRKSKINIDRKLFGYFYINAMFAKNLYKAGMRKDKVITTGETRFLSYDLNLKYSFEHYLPKNYWLEPYAYVGFEGSSDSSSLQDKLYDSFCSIPPWKAIAAIPCSFK